MGYYFYITLLLFLASTSIFSAANDQNRYKTDITLVETKIDSLPVYAPVTDSSHINIPFSEQISPDLKNLNMKVYEPDSTLTEKMPILVPEPIDNEMLIPRFLRKKGIPKLSIIQ